MIRLQSRVLSLLVLGLVTAGTARAQVATGTPPFGSFSGGPDVVNNANLNVHIAVPVLEKAGRGLPFYYILSYDSSVWYPTGTAPNQAWTPVTNWGWRGKTEVSIGYTSYSSKQMRCKDLDSGNWVYFNIYFRWTYHDSFGVPHVFDVASQDSACEYYETDHVGTARDGSGYTIDAFADSATLTSRTGEAIDAPIMNPSAAGTATDANGNQIRATYSSGTVTFTDTLGLTALTASGSGTQSSPVVFTYTGPAGSASVTMKYTNFNIKTNFGCSGITEYAASNVPLVSEIDLPDGTKYTFSYEDTVANSGYTTGRLGSVTGPTGGTISYDYGNDTQHNNITCADGSAATLKRFTPDTGSNYWQYAHAENGVTAWTTTTTDPQGNQTVANFRTIYETHRKEYQGTTTLVRQVDTCYNGASIPCSSIGLTLPISDRTVQITLPGLSPSQTYAVYNTYGLPTEADEYDYGLSLVRKTLIAYAIYARPSQIKIQDGSGATKAQTDFSYDSRGNLLSETRYTGGTPATISRSFTYSSSGVLQTATDFNGHQTAYTNNGCSSSFPTTISLPLSLSRSLTWNCTGAVITSFKDENSKTTNFTYTDPNKFWRLTETDYPDGGVTTTAYSDPVGGPFSITTSTKLNATPQYFTAQSILDGLARARKSLLTSDPQGTDYSRLAYDSLGRTYQQWNPTRCDPDAGNCGEQTYGITTYYYDPLNRLTSIVRPDSSTATTTYSANCATSADEAGKARTVCTEALGRVTSVTEDPSGLNYQTTYTYDVLGNLTGVSQGGETRSYTYDMLSRLTQATTPESGTTYFYYTTSGSALCSGDANAVCRRKDARSVTTTYAYDALNRLTGKSYSNGDPSVSYFYDQTGYNGLTISNGKGRRTGMSDGSGQTAWSYDAMGRVLTERRTIGSITKSISYAYNLDGSVASVTYPSGRVISYDVTGAGQPAYAKDLANGINYALNTTYAPQGAVSSALEGQSGAFGGITWSGSYNNRLLPTSFTATSENGTALNLAFNYFGNGNVSTVTNNRDTSRTQTFTYDNLNRVATGQSQATSGGNCWGQSFGYDRYANLTTITVTKCSAPMLSLSINTQNRITNSGFNYDAAGNMTADGTYSYTWNGENRLSTAAGVTYTYDGDGRRVKKSSGTLYWYGGGGVPLAETDLSGNTTNEYILFAGARIARHDASGNVYYYFADHLGSSRTIANSAGAVCYEADFYPFGGERVIGNTCAQNYKFAGMERDSETGNDQTWFRYYASNLGRWLSPDPVAGSIYNPQSLNRYAYVLNNPTNLIDPLGLIPPTSVSNDYGGGGTCYLYGVEIGCSFVLGFGFVGSGAVVQCPNNQCSGSAWDSVSGQWVAVQFFAFAGGASGYFRPGDIMQGVYDFNGVLYTSAGWRKFVQANFADRIAMQRQAVIRALAARFGVSEAEAADMLGKTEDGSYSGGNYGFKYSGPDAMCSAGRCNDGLHFRGDTVHLDSANPFFGDVWSFLVHGFVDVIYGNAFTVLIPRH
jgi:RHS repeat-associated protein